MQPHDSSYKNIFSHKESMRDLLRGFVPEQWVSLLDFDQLQKQSPQFTTDDLRTREDDIIWRLPMRVSNTAKPQWVYVYVLAEFQSQNDPAMAVRILSYTALLYQDLIKSGSCAPGQLPWVFPIVIYNGEAPWSAKLHLHELRTSAPGGLEIYQPQMRYFVLDEGRVDQTKIQPDNTVSGLIKLEHSASHTEFLHSAQQHLELLDLYGNLELKRAFWSWLHRCALPRFETNPDAHELNLEINNLHEANKMLSERIKIWEKNISEQSLLQGLAQGEIKGEARGEARGEAKSFKRLLVGKFGPLSAEIEAKVARATPEQIDAWFDAAIDAATLDAVFANH
jgi:predicted transposase/invertase (TIGR01784 family)